jgi:hypothetical protein
MTTSDQPMDHVPPAADSGDRSEQSDLEKNVKMRSTWLRLFFMIIFALLYGLSRLVTAAVIVIQFFHVLFTGDTNEQLRTFGHSLAVYSFEVIDYLTFNSETKPFPLEAEWPEDLPERTAGDAIEEADDA